MKHTSFDPKKADPTERAFRLKAQIVVKDHSYLEDLKNGEHKPHTRKFVYLVPEMNDQMVAFFSAHLGPTCLGCEMHPPAASPGCPCTQPQIEVILDIKSPFDVYARCSVEHPSKLMPEDHHLFLMSYGLSQIILNNKSLHGKSLEFTVLPAGMDHPDGSPADQADSGDELLPFRKK